MKKEGKTMPKATSRSKSSHEKTLEEMDMSELASYWTGYALMEIGQGKFLRDAIYLMLTNTYSHGLAAGRKEKR